MKIQNPHGKKPNLEVSNPRKFKGTQIIHENPKNNVQKLELNVNRSIGKKTYQECLKTEKSRQKVAAETVSNPVQVGAFEHVLKLSFRLKTGSK